MFKYIFQKVKNNKTIRDILRMSWPIMSINIFQSAYQLIDTFWVGRIGADAISSVSITFPIIFFFTSIASGVTVATSIIISQYKGKQDEEKIKFVSSQVLMIVFFSSVLLAVIGYLLSQPLLELEGVRGDVLKNAMYYVKICIIGLPAVYLFYAFQSIEKGLGNMRRSMRIMIATCLLNVILDPIFIFNLNGGVAGAAIATIICQFISAILSLYYLYGDDKRIIINLKYLSINKLLLKKIKDLGIPSFLIQASSAIGLYIITVITVFITKLDTNLIASISIGLRIFLFILIPANAISAATSVSVGQNLGADNIKGAKRAIKLGCLISFVLLSSLGIICFIFAYKIAGFFVNNKNAIVIQETGRFLRAVSLIFGFLGAQLSMLGAFTGSGDTKRSTLLTVLTGGLMLLFGFILSNTKMGYFGLYIAFPLAGFISLIITYIIYRKENWTHRRITQELENKE